MPYYGRGRMNYAAGDNYGRAGNYAYQAGGIFSSIGRAIGGIARVAGAVLPGPAGTIARVAGGILAPRPATPQLPGLTLASIPQVPEPGVTGAIHRAIPGGHTGLGYYNKKGEFIEGKRPTMNPMNVRALRRASRRLDSFARTARKALRHSPFMLVSRATRGRRGSPGVITRSEAARALKR